MSKFDLAYIDIKNSSYDGDPKYNVRYSLTLCKHGVHQIGKTAIIILKKPASTCKSCIFYSTNLQDTYDVDKTTSHIINTLFVNGTTYDKIITLNLFPYYDNIPAAINSVYNNLFSTPHISYNNNLNKMDAIIKNNSGADVFCAWGQASGILNSIYDKAITDVIAILLANNISNYKYYDQTGQKTTTLSSQPFYPLHGSKW